MWTFPPSPESPTPTFIVMSPACLPTANNVEMEIVPDAPSFEVPVKRSIVPLTPSTPAFTVDNEILPLLVGRLEPL
jgi:hypothetical protein